MPNPKNFPNRYDEYVKLAKLTHRSSALPLLNRFVFRYRLAEDFEGIIAPNIGRSLLGYNVITKIFLAYTAYEAAIKAARFIRVSSVLSPELNTRFDPELAKRIRLNLELKSYLLSYAYEASLSTKLKLFFDGTTSDIICVAYALRNVFAHGDLTASVIGTETIVKRKVFTDLANAILDYCDEIFDKSILRL